MLVSATAGPDLREDVRACRRPCPEYLRLEQAEAVELLDWSKLGNPRGGRSAARSLHQVVTALRRLEGHGAVFSDGEHLGIPMVYGMQALRKSVPHLMIGHHLTTRAKAPFFRQLHADRQITRIVVHTRHQLERAHELGIPRPKLRLIPYGVDTGFWHPSAAAPEPLILAPGREHRDFRTLADASAGVPARVLLTAASAHHPGARVNPASSWPPNVEVGALDYRALRDRYACASLVVVPLIDNDFPAGVTAVLESMAMGKATVVSATAGLNGIIEDDETGVLVPPGDSAALHETMRSLLGNPAKRARLGRNARVAAEQAFSLDRYVRRLMAELDDVVRGVQGI